MGRLLVLVNGLPGAGKSTVGQALARVLGARFLSKDTVKEGLAACVDDPADLPDLGGVAMDAVWSLARTSPTSVVIDSWWFAPRESRSTPAHLTDHSVGGARNLRPPEPLGDADNVGALAHSASASTTPVAAIRSSTAEPSGCHQPQARS
ncbi:AAA family ATPase [Nocardia violaceofusca]|uniref:AAA family ATPase n=1 Tax=Nocardia violaceofusca TaxID=941182 RepID=UPI0018DC4275|nr:AAA family ATPase [Nocardia violaceofusca]